jgi:hypothetical protein
MNNRKIIDARAFREELGEILMAAIRKTQVEKKKLFITRTVDRLEIDIHGEEVPYIIEKGIIKDDFEWVTGVLKSFAEKNKVNYIE